MIKLLMLALALAPFAIAQTGTIAHVADGGGWRTTFLMTNLTNVRHKGKC